MKNKGIQEARCVVCLEEKEDDTIINISGKKCAQ